MYTLLIIVTIIICLLLSIIVLVQNPKGGGLDASFGGGSSNAFGAARTTDFLEKATWVLAILLVVISMASAMAIGRGSDTPSADDILKQAPATEIAPSTTPLNEEPVLTEPTTIEPVEQEEN